MQKQYFSWSVIYSSTALLAASIFFFEKGLPLSIGASDIPGLLLIALHLSAGLYYFSRLLIKPDVVTSGMMAERLAYRMGQQDRQPESEDFMLLPDLLFSISLVIFLFAYIFALAANMDYVQRFIATQGKLQLALDTKTERMFVLLRYGVYLLVYLVIAGIPILINSGGNRRRNLRILKPMTLLLGSSLLFSFSFPSTISVNGISLFAWFSMVPLFILLRQAPGFRRWLFYGLFWSLFTILIRNYWLGTFSLVSFQVSVMILGSYGLVFFIVLWFAEKFIRLMKEFYPERRLFNILLYAGLYSSLFTIYDWIFTRGFAAYPWSLMPQTQWRNLALLQITPLTGMWGISQLLYLSNAFIAEFFMARPSQRRYYRKILLSYALVVAVIHGAGALVLLQHSSPTIEPVSVLELKEDGQVDVSMENTVPPANGDVRIALVQQNSDPRKSDYEQVFKTLQTLSNNILEISPDTELLAWSETAFVPNIARWGAPDANPGLRYVRVVRNFLDYQKQTGVWLLTGNDDYSVTTNADGREIDRKDYNAAILFDPDGNRVATYHKIKLVPFTEYFPYKNILPGVYKMLENFDVHFWEPGTERTVFQIPGMSFSTPICFEDAFPNQVRKFIDAGAGVILNISNDYWSLTEVAAKQHFAAALFRATENRRPLLRSTASGMTAAVDSYGRVVLELPTYKAMAASIDLHPDKNPRETIYSRFGDWYIVFLAILSVGAIIFMSLRSRISAKRRAERQERRENGRRTGRNAVRPD